MGILWMVAISQSLSAAVLLTFLWMRRGAKREAQSAIERLAVRMSKEPDAAMRQDLIVSQKIIAYNAEQRLKFRTWTVAFPAPAAAAEAVLPEQRRPRLSADLEGLAGSETRRRVADDG